MEMADMAHPEAPTLQTSYTAKEQELGNGTFPGQELDVDLIAVRDSITAVVAFLKGLSRSDGKLKNGLVTREAFASDITLGFEAPSVWKAGAAYKPPATVFFQDGFFICTQDHTAGADFNVDLGSGRWAKIVDFGQKATDAANSAASAAVSAASASSSEITATVKASEAVGAAATATAKASEASGSATSASASAASAGASATSASQSESNAAASAAAAVTFDPALYLAKADNLSGVADAAIARSNIGAASAADAANAFGAVLTAGTGAAYTLAAASTISAYATNQVFLIRVHIDNTGAVTINVDGQGAKAVQKYNASGALVDLAAGDWQQGEIHRITYDGTRFVCVTPVAANTTERGVVRKSTSAENTAGTAIDAVPHVAGVREIIKGAASRTYYDEVAAGKVAGTAYQNTADYPIHVFVTLSLSYSSGLEVSNDNVTWFTVGTGDTGHDVSASVEVPPGGYYRVTGGVFTWGALR